MSLVSSAAVVCHPQQLCCVFNKPAQTSRGAKRAKPARLFRGIAVVVLSVFLTKGSHTVSAAQRVSASLAHHASHLGSEHRRHGMRIRSSAPRRVERQRVSGWMKLPACRAQDIAPREDSGTLAASPEVIAAVHQAVQAVELDPVLLLAIARAESRFQPEAQNRLSTARGLLQFTRNTWLEVVREFGAQHGLTEYADAVRKNRSGRLSVDRPAVLKAILRLRDDPRLSAAMAADRMTHLRGTLERDLGQHAAAADLYLLHVLGPDGAARFLAALRQHPDVPSVDVVGSITRPNTGLFISRGCALTIAQVYARIGALLDAGRDQYGAALASYETGHGTQTPQVREGSVAVTEPAAAPP